MLLQVQNRQGGMPVVQGTREGFPIVQENYLEAIRNGNGFAVSDQAGGAMPAGLSTAPINVVLFNPKGNSKGAAILSAGLVSAVAPAAIAFIWVAVNNNVAAAAVTGTAGVPRNLAVGNGNAPTVLTLTTATLPAAPVAIDVLGTLLTGAITVQTQQAALYKWYGGSIVLLPGSALSFQASAASAAAGVQGSWMWVEYDL